MRIFKIIVAWVAIVLVAGAVGVAAGLYFAPPALIRLGSGYAAKIVCSNVFIAGRDAGEVLAVDVQAPGNPLLRLISVDVDRQNGVVSAGLFGIIGRNLAAYREGTGCATVPDGDIATAQAFTAPPPAGSPHTQVPWPQGAKVQTPGDPAIADILDDPDMTGPGTRAVVVVDDGRIVGERYGDGFSAATPLIGWSMTKTVTAAIVGILVREGKMSRDQTGLFARWAEDKRAEISVADMLAMASGLKFNENYGAVTDVTRMLYLEPDMAAFAASKPLVHPIGTVFNYSSGTSVMMARVWQNAVGDEVASLRWPREHLFGPLGMTSAVMEADEHGTFVGSSYLYATARDWARFGQFLLQDGVWQGRRLLPEGYVEWMREPTAVSNGEYGRFVWLRGPGAGTAENTNPDAEFDIPDDAYWMIGHDGQTVTIIPSQDLVIVRLGLTPSRLGYKPQRMVEALVKVLGKDAADASASE